MLESLVAELSDAEVRKNYCEILEGYGTLDFDVREAAKEVLSQKELEQDILGIVKSLIKHINHLNYLDSGDIE